MSITKGIIDWLETCPLVSDVSEFDIGQVKDGEVGIYKQPAVTVEKLIDGNEIRTEYYYFLFMRPAQIKPDRVGNDELLQEIEEWILSQDFDENYPDIGYPVYGIGMNDSYYMTERDEDTATYQITLEIKYERTI